MNSDGLMKSDDLNDTKIDPIPGDEKDIKKFIGPPTPCFQRKLKFLSPSTKVADVHSAEKEGRTLKNRRISTLMLPDIPRKHVPKGTSSRVSEAATGTLIRTPYTECKNPAIWLSSSRWAFLPKSQSELDKGYTCPEGVRITLGEDIAKLKNRQINVLTNSDLLEFHEYLNELAARKAKSAQSKISGSSSLTGAKKYWNRMRSKS
ncbi:uncharacterized protein MELLADRAFT_103917 [Melampsora larici-populina 98AG31]|uniref:Uncharacterized protein n=1 Tax=Melampsora larici-populina (strain 98AG31 / pathotype 3-4-7) TaxID=747676 RepID=F4RCZ6_MELLP|nr:uncharacterized protein MELLADRAFT_103917 [Melampsora larici-populina 98AG31]EGG09810.1 hypothetical protein MELLADRAFT_103917 [Melampsora larici-populina 98AG31]